MGKPIADPIVRRRGIESSQRVAGDLRPLGPPPFRRSETVALIALEAYLDLLTRAVSLWIKLYDSHIKMH